MKVVLEDGVRGGSGRSGSSAVVCVYWMSQPDRWLTAGVASESEFAITGIPLAALLPAADTLYGKYVSTAFAVFLFCRSPANL